MKGATPGSRGVMSDSGWSNYQILRQYLEEHFLPSIAREENQHILLIFDGHSSHIFKSLIEWAASKKVILFVLPAHTSHILQPLDVGIFGPFKRFYYGECAAFMRENMGTVVTKYDMVKIACRAYLKAMSPINIMAAFQKSGIYPLNKDAVSPDKLYPAESYRDINPIQKLKALQSGKEAVEMYLAKQYEKEEITKFNTLEKGTQHCQCCCKAIKKTAKPKAGGSAITEEPFVEKLNTYELEKMQSDKKRGKQAEKKKRKQAIVEDIEEPSTSGININNNKTRIDSDSDMDTDEYSDSELCCVFTSTYESGPMAIDDFPKTSEPVDILGVQYSVLYDLQEIREDVRSRLWFTYRRGFPPIGGTGPNTDTGWGCMLRCGQMMLGEALIRRHLGRDWRKHGHNERYQKILAMFQDKKSAYYSIHQIASMGVSEGKNVGQWFGPNTIAQVLRKLVVYDDWSSLVIHVAMDNSVIIDDIKCLCKGKNSDDIDKRVISGNNDSRETSRNDDLIDYSSSNSELRGMKSSSETEPWKPLLLIIPLRLGLTDTNVVYVESLKKCLGFKQSVGMIGGKPNHAHWFIGTVGEELVFLDPHTTQTMVDLDENPLQDESYHCRHSSRMKILDLDPSIALGFYCGTEAEFDDLCSNIEKYVTCRRTTAMFELHKERPLHWPPYEPYRANASVNTKEFHVVDKKSEESDEDFELVG